jgi:hypothetical protein
LDDVVAGQVRFNDQRVDSSAFIGEFGLHQNGLAINGDNVLDVVDVTGAGWGVVLHVGGPGVSNIFGGYRRAIIPMSGRVDGEGNLSARVVPGKWTGGQQRIHLAVEHVVQIRGLKHGHAGIVLLGNGHGVVVAVGIGVPTNNRTPLLSIEVQGFVAGQGIGVSGRFFCRGGFFLNRGGFFFSWSSFFFGRGGFFLNRSSFFFSWHGFFFGRSSFFFRWRSYVCGFFFLSWC